MERLRSRDLRRLLDFLPGLYAAQSLDSLVDHLVRHLHTLIPCDSAVYNDADVRRRRVIWREEPSIAATLPDGRRIFERHMRQHPLIAHAWDGRAARILDFLTTRQFHDLGLYQDFFRRLQLEHQLSIGVPALAPRLIVVNANRRRTKFSARDRLLMELLRPHLAQAHRTAELIGSLREGAPGLASHVEAVTVGGGGRIRSATPRGRAWLERYFAGPGPGADRLPPMLAAWVRQQAARPGRGRDGPRAPLAMRGAHGRLEIHLVSEAGREVLLLQEHPAAPEPRRLEALGLSRREAEVLAWVTEGKTNPEISAILGLSPRTVGNHLARVYARLGVETRTAAARIALTGH